MIRSRSTPFVLLAVLTAACGDDGAIDPSALAPRGIAVLDGYIQPGLTLLPDSGPGSQRIAFGAPDEFDGGSFELRSDTAVAASSRGAGDLLYVASLTSGTVRRVQMPARSNPARARLLRGSGGQALVGVPLRDSGAVVLASISSTGQATLDRITDVGACPVDVVQHEGDVWVLDANARCATDYSAIGPVRLIRIPSGGGTRQVLTIDGVYGSGSSLVVQGGVAYVIGGGDADFSDFPYQLVYGSAIGRVDLGTRAVLGTKPLPAGAYAAGGRLGVDGRLQVTAYENLTTFEYRTVSYRLPDLVPMGTRIPGSDWLLLHDAEGAQVNCGAAIVDARERLHCIETRFPGSATFLMVFGPDGSLLREAPAGQGGVDLRLR